MLALLALLPVYAFLRGRVGKLSALRFSSADIARAAGGGARAAAGRLLVADAGSRVLAYAPPLATNAPAIRILGVDTSQNAPSTTAIAVNRPLGVADTPAGVIVPDTFNNRVLVFPTVDSWPPESTQFSPSATAVSAPSPPCNPNGSRKEIGLPAAY